MSSVRRLSRTVCLKTGAEMGALFNYRRRLELLLLVAILFLAFAAGDTWIAWVRRRNERERGPHGH